MQLETTAAGFIIQGNIDFQEVTYMLSEGMRIISAHGEGCVLIDFSLVDNCTIAALAMIVSWQRLAASKGKAVRIVGAPESLQQMLKLSGLAATLLADPE